MVKKIVKKTNIKATKLSKFKVVQKSLKKILHKLTLKKNPGNPIISPRQDNSFDGWQTFNPGVIQLDNKVHFLYRAIGPDGISRLGYASSNDGFIINERLTNPAYEHKVTERSYNVFSSFSGGSWGGGEDPRLVRIDNEDLIYMTYTACNGDLRVALTSIRVDDFRNKRWNWSPPLLLSPLGEVHKNWLIFPEKINNQYAILHSVNPEIQIEYRDNLEFNDSNYIISYHGGKPRKKCWDKWIRGAGPVPIKTKYGWLLFYHAMDNDWSKYKVGAMLLDLKNPSKVITRAKAPVLIPTEIYENSGFKSGVVYASGATVKNGELLLYYGGADSYVCVASTNFDEFVEILYQNKEPKLNTRKLRQ